ncbi:Lar family restriction alleviation protein [Achromobacter aegrifaciens]|uniref:Lar family restriction alleviation protein n=1 Tax=Achromobacter aegrifaciens TaxID=1287736 RepID=UPI00278D3A1D|nr:Lar family restriction alleviation protein [Achromobacter aegrifaciens]MDQ1758978.1 Lar family restriction alleviation protein [Achromobacter aegrifaciens]
MADLKPCPFCGGTRIFVEPDEYGSGGQWVSPIHVGCSGCKAEQMGDTKAEAFERWNRRATTDNKEQ